MSQVCAFPVPDNHPTRQFSLSASQPFVLCSIKPRMSPERTELVPRRISLPKLRPAGDVLGTAPFPRSRLAEAHRIPARLLQPPSVSSSTLIKCRKRRAAYQKRSHTDPYPLESRSPSRRSGRCRSCGVLQFSHAAHQHHSSFTIPRHPCNSLG